MSRYIDMDKVLKELRLNHKDVIYIDKRDTAKRIEKIPTIDIVRCKECDMSEVYQSDSNGVMSRYCKAFTPTRMIADDDYCSYGERTNGQTLNLADE